MKNITDYIQQWANTYKDDMQNNIMPFWIKYGLDRVNGGIYTCVDRDGALMDSTKIRLVSGAFCIYLFLCL